MFLVAGEYVLEDKITNSERSAKINPERLANIHYIEKNGADFFVTGDTQMELGLDLNYIPHTQSRGVNLSATNQTLQQGFQIAKNIFKHIKLGTIKFVLIGLTPPYVVSANEKESPVVCEVDKKVLEDYFNLCVDNGVKPICVVLPVNAAVKKTYNADVLKAFRDTIDKVVKKYKATFIDLLDVKLSEKLFKDKVHLNSEGSAAVSVLLGEKLYFAKIFSVENILDMNNDFFNVLSKYFSDDYKKLTHHTFCRVACDDFNRLSKTSSKETCLELMASVFSGLTYNHLANLSDMLLKDEYNDLADRTFKISAEKIRRKHKIKVGFYFMYGSMWFGDDLYNLFARDERFEPTLFLNTKFHNEGTNEEAIKDFEKLKSHGINIFDLNDRTIRIPEQDVFFCLMPYLNAPPVPFRLVNLKLTTLLAHFPYSLSVTDRGGLRNAPFYRVLWKMFAPSPVELEILRERNKVFSASRMIYSGYTKMDIFFRKDTNVKFNWKMTRPEAKKIIWAPHHSVVNNGPLLSTFHWNYKFIYEFAKSHPEISWVVKPHSNIYHYLVYVSKVFPTVKALQEYLQKWDDLPNAQVYMGAYYQDVFTTSDGMIQDSGSFIAEYQYVDKPMIYLTRDTQRFNELGNEILKASYTVDGKDLDGIAAMIQRVFIEGDDYKAAERKKVFDKYLNYPEYTGMLASEFIYNSIVDELKEQKKI